MDPCTRCDECTKLCEIVPEMAGMFKALGDLTRLQIIHLLASDTSGTLGVSELAARLGISQPAVSQHLKTLKSEGIVDSRREGFFVYYTINRGRIMQFREQFELMYASVMENCDREMIRRTKIDRAFRACVIYYSYSGITRGIAEDIRNASGCDLIEVRTKVPYSSFTAYTTGVLRARNMSCDPIEPDTIDVSGYDFLIIGTPVWAWRPAPAINAAVKALRGCDGKMAVIFTTCSDHPGEAPELLNDALEERGVKVMAMVCLTKEDTKNPDAGSELLHRIVAAYPLKDLHEDVATEKTRTENR